MTTTVLERRRLRRPDGAGGGDVGGAAGVMRCDGHDLLRDGGDTRLELRDPDAEAVVPSWSLRFGLIDGAWRPLKLVAPFTVRVVFVPVQGPVVTTFEGWRFGAE